MRTSGQCGQVLLSANPHTQLCSENSATIFLLVGTPGIYLCEIRGGESETVAGFPHSLSGRE
jgi:hypothetical protein